MEGPQVRKFWGAFALLASVIIVSPALAQWASPPIGAAKTAIGTATVIATGTTTPADCSATLFNVVGIIAPVTLNLPASCPDGTLIEVHDTDSSITPTNTLTVQVGSNGDTGSVIATGATTSPNGATDVISLGGAVLTYRLTSHSGLANTWDNITHKTFSTTGTGSTVVLSAGGALTGVTGLGYRDTSAAFDVTLGFTSSTTLTAGRALTVVVVNGARTFKLGSNLTIVTDPGAVSGAVKSNGTGTFTQAACADLSDAGSGCTGSSGTSNVVSTGACLTLATTAVTRFCPWSGQANAAASATNQLAGHAITIKEIHCAVTVTPGASNSHTFSVVVAGSSVSATNCAISGNGPTTCDVTGLSSAVTAAQTLSYQDVTAGTPSASSGACAVGGT